MILANQRKLIKGKSKNRAFERACKINIPPRIVDYVEQTKREQNFRIFEKTGRFI